MSRVRNMPKLAEMETVHSKDSKTPTRKETMPKHVGCFSFFTNIISRPSKNGKKQTLHLQSTPSRGTELSGSQASTPSSSPSHRKAASEAPVDKVVADLADHYSKASPQIEIHEEEITRQMDLNGKVQIKIGEYLCLSLIGKGSFGKVFLAKRPDGSACAIKALPKDKLTTPRKRRLVTDEKYVMSVCAEHPFILSLDHAFQTKEFLCLVSPFCSGGELFFHLDKAGRFDEDQVRFYSAEISTALFFLHEHRIAYRDLKSENLLLDDLGHIRLADFGLAAPNVSEWRGARSICGTPAYIAPEMIRLGGRCKPGYGYSVDYWALGTLIYDFLCGHPPFYNQNMEVMCESILSKPLAFPSTMELSEDIKDLIRGLLRRTPENRLGSSKNGGPSSIKQHPFFAIIEWDTVESNSTKPAVIQSVAVDTNSKVIPGSATTVKLTNTPFSVCNFHQDFTNCSVEENLRSKPQPKPAQGLPRSASTPYKKTGPGGDLKPPFGSPKQVQPFVDWDYVAPVRSMSHPELSRIGENLLQKKAEPESSSQPIEQQPQDSPLSSAEEVPFPEAVPVSESLTDSEKQTKESVDVALVESDIQIA